MKLIRKIACAFLKNMPYRFLTKYYHILIKTKLVDITNEIVYERFFNESKLVNDFDNFVSEVKKSNKYCIINKGLFDYRIVNFCFINDMLSNIIWCLENRYKPIINIYPVGGNYLDNCNLWERYFIQPFGEKSDIAQKKRNKIICPINSFIIHPSTADIKDKQKVLFWNKMLKSFAVFNDETQKYFNDELKIIEGKYVLGCLGRGTDYTDTRPKGHPVQPDIDELVTMAERMFYAGNFNYIYLATEEKKIADAFKERFPGKILENKRNYYDEIYFQRNLKRVSYVNFGREDDDYLKMLEYMSSINLLSKCDALVAGLCGGSETAVYWNGLRYKECYLFDKGAY